LILQISKSQIHCIGNTDVRSVIKNQHFLIIT
jgi:hypothetical protein